LRPDLLVAVTGTGTDVGKTWVTVAVARTLRDAGHAVRARKPAQSFDPADAPDTRDAALLGAATGECADDVCPSHRSYEVAMAPPMAAAALARPRIELAALVDELRWPPGTAVGFVETAGGVCSPIADDADNVDLVHAIAPDVTLLVADAGLGTINLVRLAVGALGRFGVLVVLNRHDASDDLHRRNRAWLEGDGLDVVVSPDEVATRLAEQSRA
jgi:dethiobiotin synthetase